jgi:predicted DNA binding protein
VAETLDIAGSTLLYHLRRAQRKLVEAYFERDRETPTDS